MAYIGNKRILFSADVNITTGGDRPDQSKIITPSLEEQTVYADAGYELHSVTVKGIPDNSVLLVDGTNATFEYDEETKTLNIITG